LKSLRLGAVAAGPGAGPSVPGNSADTGCQRRSPLARRRAPGEPETRPGAESADGDPAVPGRPGRRP
jgi:hypothetical protein